MDLRNSIFALSTSVASASAIEYGPLLVTVAIERFRDMVVDYLANVALVFMHYSLVELRGFEPLTSAVQERRSPN